MTVSRIAARRGLAAATAAALLTGLAVSVPATADPYQAAYTKLTADGVPEDNFGSAVAVDGDTAIVGAFLADIGEISNQGSAHIYARTADGWSRQATLAPDETEYGLLFGQSVAIDGDTAVVGALGSYVNGSRPGAAFVFTRDGDAWTQRAKLVADDLQQWGANFGQSVAVDGDTILVGAASAHNGNNNVQGAAYTFRRDGGEWTLDQKLLASDGSSFNSFGSAVALDGDAMVIGAPGATVDGNFWQGAAYVFHAAEDGWTEQQKLRPSDGVPNAEFGAGVAIHGDRLVVGAGGPDSSFIDYDRPGAAYVFARSGDTWAEEAKLSAADGHPGDLLGRSVAIDGDTVAAGAKSYGKEPGVDLEKGAAVVFTRADGAWAQEVAFTASDTSYGDHLGSAVAISGDDVLTGAPHADVNGDTDRGAAYVFTPGRRAPQPPSIAVTGTGLDPMIAAGGTAIGSLEIANAGEQDLEWEIGGAGALTGLQRPAGPATEVVTASANTPAEGSDWTTGGVTGPAGTRGPVSAAGDPPSFEPSPMLTLTHSASMDVIEGNTVSCANNENGTTRENHGLRTFTLADFGVAGTFDVTEVTFGVERVTNEAELRVNLYTVEGPLSYFNLDRLATATVTLEPQGPSVVDVPITARVPAGATLVMEVVTPDMKDIGRVHLGSNDAGETAPSYVSSEPCGSPEPVTYASVGGAHVHLVMAVIGISNEPIDCELPEWLTVGSGSGAVTPGEAATVDVGFDAAGLDEGKHAAHLCVTSNDPLTPMVAVPVTLTVGDDGTSKLTLAVESRQHRGEWYADLSWTGASGGDVDVYRDGELVATVTNSDEHTDPLGRPRKGDTFTYQVCEAGSVTCSEPVTIAPKGELKSRP